MMRSAKDQSDPLFSYQATVSSIDCEPEGASIANSTMAYPALRVEVANAQVLTHEPFDVRVTAADGAPSRAAPKRHSRPAADAQSHAMPTPASDSHNASVGVVSDTAKSSSAPAMTSAAASAASACILL